MQRAVSKNAPKKPTNVSINKELLDEARALNINLSATLEQALTDRVREARQQEWLANNQEAIDTCNVLAEENGLFSDKHRVF